MSGTISLCYIRASECCSYPDFVMRLQTKRLFKLFFHLEMYYANNNQREAFYPYCGIIPFKTWAFLFVFDIAVALFASQQNHTVVAFCFFVFCCIVIQEVLTFLHVTMYTRKAMWSFTGTISVGTVFQVSYKKRYVRYILIHYVFCHRGLNLRDWPRTLAVCPMYKADVFGFTWLAYVCLCTSCFQNSFISLITIVESKWCEEMQELKIWTNQKSVCYFQILRAF